MKHTVEDRLMTNRRLTLRRFWFMAAEFTVTVTSIATVVAIAKYGL